MDLPGANCIRASGQPMNMVDLGVLSATDVDIPASP